MELKDLVNGTLQEIFEGVKKAQNDTAKFGGVIVPKLGSQAPGTLRKLSM